MLFAFLLSMLAVTLASCSLFGGSKTEKKQLSEEMIFSFFVGDTYVYSGQPIEFEKRNLDVRVDGRYVSCDYFDMTFSDNVNVGTASVTITAKPENPTVQGSVTVHFYIQPNNSYYCKSTDDLAAVFASPNIQGVTMWINYTIPEDSTVIIPAGKSLLLQYGYRLENHGKIENYGTIKMTGAHLSTGGRRDSELENYGTIKNHGTFTILDHAVIDDCGVFTSDNTISNAGTVYLKDQDKPFLSQEQGGVKYLRKRLTAEHILVDGCVCKKGYYSYSPAVTLADCRDRDFTTEYFDNLGAGQGRVTVTMYPRAKDYYGEATALFTIEKGVETAADLTELKTLSDSGNFYEYKMSALTIPGGDSFSLREGDILTLTSDLTVIGTFANGGILSCDSLSVGNDACFTNGGNLSTQKAIQVFGSFTNECAGVYSAGTGVQIRKAGTFLNQADLSGERVVSIDGTFVNEGSMTIANAYTFGTLVNRGTLCFPQGLNISTAGSFVNEQSGIATLSADSNFRNYFENRGTVVSEGRLAVADGSTFLNTGSFDNRGGVWAFAPLAGVSGEVVIRKYLTDESVLFEADYTEIIYDKNEHVPAFTVDSETLPTDLYRLKLRYVGSEKDVDTCVAAGEVQMTVTILPIYCMYAGTYVYSYTILHATAHIENKNDFLEVYSDASYDNIVLETDLTLTGYSSYYIGRGCTFNLNGHKFTATDRSTFSLYGTLMGGAPLPESPSEEAVSILITENADFHNYGTLVNDGILLARGAANFQGNAKAYLSDVKGSIVNNGAIYTNDLYPLYVTGEGKVYRRTLATVLNGCVVMPVVEYDGTHQTPVPQAIAYKSASVSVDRFRYEYDESNNVAAGDLAFIRLIVASSFDPDFYGKADMNFSIRRGATQVNNVGDFLAAAANVNYDRIRLTNHLLLTQEVTLRDGQSLDISSYELSFSGNGKLVYGKNCRLLLTANTEERFLKYFYGADEITLTADIGVADTPTELTFPKDYRIPNVTGGNYLSTVVHANGFSFLGGLKIVNGMIENFAITLENSSDEESTIGSAVPTAVNQFALVYGACTEETYLTLRNFTVYGAKMGGGTGTAQEVKLTAENCGFYADTRLASAYAFTVRSTMTAVCEFTSCEFEGANAFRADQGDLTFTSCSIYSCDSYSNSYSSHYGDGVLLNYYGRHGLHASFVDTHITSVYGNGIHLHNANSAVTLSVDNATTYSGPLLKVLSSAD